MSDSFDTSLPPFDRLSSEQQQRLTDSLDVAYYRHGDILVEAGKPSEQLHIIIKAALRKVRLTAVKSMPITPAMIYSMCAPS